MEWAFSGPYTIAGRLGGDRLDAQEIAAHDPEGFAALLSEKPAVHRYPRDGRAHPAAVRVSGRALRRRPDRHVARCPLRCGTAPAAERTTGFRQAEGADLPRAAGQAARGAAQGLARGRRSYGEEGAYRSVADITGPESLDKVRAHKQELKRQAKQAKG
ncbi:HhH-GPD-type base excision DNA repair protein [Streptomyces antimycoticus]